MIRSHLGTECDQIAGIALGAFGILAVANWVALGGSHSGRIALTKTAASVALVAVAATSGQSSTDARAVLIVAVVLCLVGDVALLGDSDGRFLAGLGSFAAGHLAYVVTALIVGVSWSRSLIAVPFLVVLFGFRFSTRTVPGARRHGGRPLMAAVLVYASLISAMVLTATGTAVWSAAVGAMLFAVSDWLLGYDRFVAPFPAARVAVMMSYHSGQLLLILGLVAAG